MIKVNKPRYLLCPTPATCFYHKKQCWKDNHIPFAGYLSAVHGGYVQAFSVIMDRYVKMKKIVLPSEFKNFAYLFKEKHPEFCGSWRVIEDMRRFSDNGAYYRPNGYVAQIFGGWDSLFSRPRYAYEPLPKCEHKAFLECSYKEIKFLEKEKRCKKN